MTFFVARIGTKKAQAEIAEIRNVLYGLFPRPKEIDENEIFANWLSDYGVIGWENVTDDESGESMPFSRDFSRRIFLNEAYWLSLNQVLITHAANYENFLNDQSYEEVEEIKKL